jgi:hypothetical protein
MRTNSRRGYRLPAASLLATLLATGVLPATGVLGFAGVARAADRPPALLPRGGERPASGPDRWQASIAMRAALVRDPGYDPFSTNDGLAQVSFSVAHALRTGLGVVPAVGLSLDVGGADAIARGADAHLGLLRLGAVLEPRFVPRPGLYLAARLVPGLQRTTATLRDASAPVVLTSSSWTPSVDASVGAGVRLSGWTTPVGLWLLTDAGYGWAPRRDLTLAPALPASDAQKAGATSLGAFAARGPFLRIGFAVSY